MSVLTLLGMNSNQIAGAYGSAKANAALQKLIEANSAAAAGATTGNGSDIAISAAATAAAAASVDNKKDFSQLASEVRTTLDGQYAAADAAGRDRPAPALTALSGRALAAIVLDQDDRFSHAEQVAAKAELTERNRQDFLGAISGGVTIDTLSAYNQQFIAQYDAMSAEERVARGWTEKMRTNADAFLKDATVPSLFDQLYAQTDDQASSENLLW